MSRLTWLLPLSSLALSACVLKADDEEAGAAGSYCEALCDWAADCAGEELGVEESTARCLEAARAANPNCATAEAGELSVADQLLLDACIGAFDDLDCSGITGEATEVSTSTPPLECITSEGEGATDAYNEGRAAAQPTGDELCESIGVQVCEHMVACLTGDYADQVTEAADALQAACEAHVTSDLVASCQEQDLDPGYGEDLNANRIAADDCVADLDALEDSCEIFSEDTWPPTCGGTIVAVEDLPGLVQSLVGFAGDYGVSL